MDKNLEQAIINANKSVWQESNSWEHAKKGLYEVWYMMVNDIQRNEAYWFHYHLLVPKRKQPESMMDGEASILFAYFNADDASKSFSVQKCYPLIKAAGTNEHFFIKIAQSSISMKGSKGKFKTRNRSIAWDLRFSRFTKPYQHIPALAEILKITTTVPITAHPNLTISGSITIDDKTRTVTAPGTQAHIKGLQYAKPWSWCHCNTFKNNPNAYFEMVYSGNKGTLGLFDGQKEYFFNDISSICKVKQNSTRTGMDFSAKGKRFEIYGRARVPEKDLQAIEYLGPTNERIYCHNSEIADANIILITKNNDGTISRTKEFVAERSVPFETTSFEKPKGKCLYWGREEEL